MKSPNWKLAGSAIFFLLTGCVLLQTPVERAYDFAQSGGMEPMEQPDLRVLGFVRALRDQADVITIYLESDGAYWPAPDVPPSDPTPLKPLMLRMAASDPSPAVAYVGRPCQYQPPERLAACDPYFWRRGRFSEPAIQALGIAVDRIKKRTGARSVNLVGYSGGGTMAALLAARRSDVRCLVTIAAPLDTSAWTERKGVSPLTGSLNPVDVVDNLAGLPQTHIRGSKDDVVPPDTGRHFLQRLPRATVIDRPEADHDCCWVGDWERIRRQTCLASAG